MLLFVHLTQVARAITTFETMKGHGQVGPLMTAVTTGSLTAEGAQINGAPDGPAPARKKKEGCLKQWGRLLGLDTFYTIAFQGNKDRSSSRRNKASNPWSAGIFRNCQDFWMDGPFFGRKQSGKALFGGETIDYTSSYDVPKGGMRYRGGYEAVPLAEEGQV